MAASRSDCSANSRMLVMSMDCTASSNCSTSMREASSVIRFEADFEFRMCSWLSK